MYSSSKTPSRRLGPRIQLIDGVSKFRSSFNPVITKEDKSIIEAKLAVEKQSTAATSERIFNNNLYINYARNPFNHGGGQKHRFSNSLSFFSASPQKLEKPVRGKKLSMVPKETTLIDEITELQSPSLRPRAQKKLQRFQKINSILIESQKTSNKIMGQMEKAKRRVARSVTEAIPSPRKLEPTKQVIGLKEEQKQKLKNLSLDEIVGMQDTNHFFNQGRKRLNIFKSVREDQENPSPFQQLSSYKFSFDSMVNKINKLSKATISTLRELSRIARQIMTSQKINVRKIIDLMENQELSIKEKEIKFIDLMGFASGRLSLQLLLQLNSGFSRANEDVSDTSSEEQNDIIMYRKEDKNFSSIFQGQGEDKKQIQEFEHIELTPRELIFRQKCSKLQERIKKLLDTKEYALSLQIKDQGVHEKLQNKLGQTFKTYLDQNQTTLNDVGKTVRRNKIFKTRDQLFKIDNLINVLKQKNQFDDVINTGFDAR